MSPPPSLYAQTPSISDRTLAALCYLFPVLPSIYAILAARSVPFVWLHAVQGVVAYATVAVIVNVLKLLPPVAGVELEPLAVGGGILTLIALAWMASRGNAFRLPWVADFAERWHAPATMLIDAGADRQKQQLEIETHQRNLSGRVAKRRKDVLPKIAGSPGPRGFEVEPAATFSGAAASLLGGLAKSHVTHAEVAIANWPLRLGDESGVRFRAQPRAFGTVTRITARLRCIESAYYRDDKRRTCTQGLILHDVAVADAAARSSADGSVSAEWRLNVPREKPPSFIAEGGSIAWLLEVELRFSKGPDTTQTFELLVLPEAVAP